jgi:aryl-alcohol dehydrogenase-like predicted oxidoreductase
MEYSRLGTTDLYISCVGFGCAPIGGYDYGKVDDSESIKAILTAIDHGINFFDTADVYGFGHSEEILGKALSLSKQDIIVATKFGINWDSDGKTWRDLSPKRVMDAVDNSLRRLKRDFVDLYQAHWPEKNTKTEDTFAVLMNCQKQGKIRYIGCSNYDLSALYEMRNIYRIESLQNPYNLLNRTIENNLLEYCKINRISFIAYSALARGFLSGKYGENCMFSGTDTRVKSKYFSNEYDDKKSLIISELKKIALNNEKTLSQIAIRWILDNLSVDCALVGLKNVEQVNDVVDSCGWKLSADDYERLSFLSEQFIETKLY